MFLKFSTRRSHFSSTTGDHFIFEVFCKAIAHYSTTAIALCLRFSAKRSLTLPQQAIALCLRFSERRSLLGMCEVLRRNPS
ncbi:hypothetical protein [Nostoc sp. 'Peltigera membranacea cyanobiont' 210A]|uniref:hypothetical protein n=1 Tax=Nostoc sp. 'Peltigera membranacea cyanobiont' 210A TaxID=2014529 RepID=UPI001180AF34|nr:hypothetical protein [Nostoc sp. 'Peltigera membranacea cyanobiont' 210A]